MRSCWGDLLTPEPVFLTEETVLRMHDTLIERFGGTFGLRDVGGLSSALATPQASFGGQLLNTSLAEMTASYLVGLVRNHPFIDGNKRTAYAVTATFLRLNGYRLGLSQNAKFELVLDIAEGRFS
ncbi:MAG: type II toxin-antitoxin system death-on-curing family toxin [Gemmatimonadota bacterium]|nr:type II toxin-antitoxin system death-on-curing family toxin [Gemmatimonadota bacterium]